MKVKVTEWQTNGSTSLVGVGGSGLVCCESRGACCKWTRCKQMSEPSSVVSADLANASPIAART